MQLLSYLIDNFPGRSLSNKKTENSKGRNPPAEEVIPCNLVTTLSRVAEFLAAVALLPASATNQLPDGERSDNQTEDEQGDQVPAPATHEAQVVADLASVALVRERQFQHGDEPILRRPLVQRIREWLSVRRRHGQVDRLIVRLSGQHERVDQCRKREHR